MKYAMILNPVAGRGAVRKAMERLIKISRQHWPNAEILISEYPKHAIQLASQMASRCDVVIAVGGDGTVHEVVNGMIKSNGNAVLGVIPIGSGNDFIKNLKIPLEFEEALEVIRRGDVTRIDVGKVNDRYFSNGLGIGFDAHVVEESMKIKKLRGFAIYLVAVLKTLNYYQNRKVHFRIGDRHSEKEIFMISFGNGVAQGGGFYLTPDAKINDGLLDICIIHALGKLKALIHLPKAIKGKHHTLEQVQFFKTKEAIITTTEGIGAHADGELVSMNLKEIRISVVPNALKVIHNGMD